MQNLHIIMYHYIRDLTHSRYPNIKGLDVKLFRLQLEFIKENFTVVTMQQVIAAYSGGSALPGNAALLTFDDGYVDNYTYVLPILEEFGFQGSFFIPGKLLDTHELLNVNKIHYILACASEEQLVLDLKQKMDWYRGDEFDYPENDTLWNEYAVDSRFDKKGTVFVKKMLQTVLPEELQTKISSELFKKYVDITEEQLFYELYLTKDHIRTMQRHGMFIGIHGYDHYWLGNLKSDKMQQDITKALSVMDEFIDKDSWVMNYPYGSYNKATIDFVKEKGAILGLSTNVGKAILNQNNRFILPRFDCNDFPPKSEGYRWV